MKIIFIIIIILIDNITAQDFYTHLDFEDSSFYGWTYDEYQASFYNEGAYDLSNHSMHTWDYLKFTSPILDATKQLYLSFDFKNYLPYTDLLITAFQLNGSHIEIDLSKKSISNNDIAAKGHGWKTLNIILPPQTQMIYIVIQGGYIYHETDFKIDNISISSLPFSDICIIPYPMNSNFPPGKMKPFVNIINRSSFSRNFSLKMKIPELNYEEIKCDSLDLNEMKKIIFPEILIPEGGLDYEVYFTNNDDSLKFNDTLKGHFNSALNKWTYFPSHIEPYNSIEFYEGIAPGGSNIIFNNNLYSLSDFRCEGVFRVSFSRFNFDDYCWDNLGSNNLNFIPYQIGGLRILKNNLYFICMFDFYKFIDSLKLFIETSKGPDSLNSSNFAHIIYKDSIIYCFNVKKNDASKGVNMYYLLSDSSSYIFNDTTITYNTYYSSSYNFISFITFRDKFIYLDLYNSQPYFCLVEPEENNPSVLKKEYVSKRPFNIGGAVAVDDEGIFFLDYSNYYNGNLYYYNYDKKLWGKITTPAHTSLDIIHHKKDSIYMLIALGFNSYIMYYKDLPMEILSNDQTDVPLINTFSLSQNYPNPFNPTTTINFSIPERNKVTIKIYDILGKEITTLLNEVKDKGNYEISFNALSLSTGVYFYRIVSGNFSQTKKMILLK